MRDAQALTEYEKHLGRSYNMVPGEYEAMLHEQRGACAICRKVPPPGRRLMVDHDHYAGKRPRGLLCGACNTALGKFKDDPALLRMAIRYLARKPRKQPLTSIILKTGLRSAADRRAYPGNRYTGPRYKVPDPKEPRIFRSLLLPPVENPPSDQDQVNDDNGADTR